jgi:hypothetical protein
MIRMMATTMSNSMSENPFCFCMGDLRIATADLIGGPVPQCLNSTQPTYWLHAFDHFGCAFKKTFTI